MISDETVPATASGEREYVTGVVALTQDEVIDVKILNHSRSKLSARVVAQVNRSLGVKESSTSAEVACDTGWFEIPAGHIDGLFWEAKMDGNYWVRIEVSSQFLIPTVRFAGEVDAGMVPIMDYRFGDFATFRPKPARSGLAEVS